MTYRIVVGVDGSPHGEAALRWALAEAEARRGEVTAAFCWEVPFLSFPGGFDREELEKAGKDFVVETVSAVAPSPSVPLRTLVAEGDTAESLITLSRDADLLVVGARGRSPFAGLVLGSVSQRCAAAAACPVVVVKQGGQPGGRAGRKSVRDPGQRLRS
jgi:nucleotide-binding universal stress UspA family protein